MSSNLLQVLRTFGQSIWLDDIQRTWLTHGQLAHLIADDGISGVTSNPSIFAAAIAKDSDYGPALAALAKRPMTSEQRAEALVVEDICRAADLLVPVFATTGGRDGYVSLEVSPRLAHDTALTVQEGERLWELVARPNLMIKVPATLAGISAIRLLVGAGINVNATLIFSVARYLKVADAYLSGLEDRLRIGAPIGQIGSVASFFISRIDTLVDSLIDAHPDAGARGLQGHTAIACARLAYRRYLELVRGERWLALAKRGGQPQRLLWASTASKNKDYPDVLYVDALIGPETINTMPLATLSAYRDHGRPATRIADDLPGCFALVDELARLGIDLDETARRLEEEGVAKFLRAYEELLGAVSAHSPGGENYL